jgi:hypothetical protein
MIKIPIYVTYGGNPRPNGFESRKEGTAFLIDLAHYIEDHANDPAVGIETVTDNQGQVSYRIPYKIGGTDPSWARVVIVEVDTSRPWEISDYDGAEGFAYLDTREFDEYNRAIN